MFQNREKCFLNEFFSTVNSMNEKLQVPKSLKSASKDKLNPNMFYRNELITENNYDLYLNKVK